MRKHTLFIVLGAAFVLLLLPFFLGVTGAHPATDDFTFATYTHSTYVKTGSIPHVIKDAISYTLRTWRDWQGTVTGVLFMAINPAVFSLEAYGWHAAVLLVLHLLAWALFLHHFLAVRIGLPGRMWLLFYLVLAPCSLIFLPDIVEGIYWYNGAWFYTGAQAVSLMTLVLCDHVAQCRSHDKYRLGLVGCFLLLFALGMDNYITAMMTLMGVLMLALVRVYTDKGQERGYSIRTAFVQIIPIAAGLCISVIAPGNKVRMAVDGAHEAGIAWLLSSVFATFQAGFFYTGRFLIKTPLLAFLLVITPELILARAGRMIAGRRIHPLLVIAGYFLVLWGMLFPHIYSSGYAGSGRVINMYHDYVLIALPVVLCLCMPDPDAGDRLRNFGRALRIPLRIVAAAALLLCLALGQQNNYVKLVTDQVTGVQAAYIAQFRQEYAILEAAQPDDDVVLPPWQVQTLTGKPTAYVDASVWTNESMANYFGVRSVRVGE